MTDSGATRSGWGEQGGGPGWGATGLALWTEASARAMASTAEVVRASLEAQRRLNDAGLELLRRQQDAAVAALLRSAAVDRGRPATGPDDLAEVARRNAEVFREGVAAALRAFDPGGRRGASEASSAAAGAEPGRPRRAA
jgi:hypothetical protein